MAVVRCAEGTLPPLDAADAANHVDHKPVVCVAMPNAEV